MNTEADTLLVVNQITKTYGLRSSPFKYFKKVFRALWRASESENADTPVEGIEALKGITFSLKAGESIGIIGRNGSGKSTLLQILAGTLQASSGAKQIHGRIGAILELGSGFHPDFTGYENLKMAMSLLGIPRKEARQLEPGIIEFAELAHAMDQPIKTYSQGMVLRLAFAIQTSIQPDILLIDEALSVGDVFFQQKCAERVKSLQQRGTAFVLVSHDTGAIRHYCQKALFLHQGKQVFCGETLKAIHYYHKLNGKEEYTELEMAEMDEGMDKYVERSETGREFWLNEDQSELTDEVIRITKISIVDNQGVPINFCQMGERIRIRIHMIGQSTYFFNTGFKLKNRYGQVVVAMSSGPAGIERIITNTTVGSEVEFELECSLQSGEYTFSFYVHENRESRGADRLIGNRYETPWLGPFQVRWDRESQSEPFHGMFGPQCSCRLLKGGG